MRQSQEVVLNAVDASVNQTSAAVVTKQVFAVSAQGVFTGTTVGVLKLQFSNDITNPPIAPTNWSDIPSATIAVTAAGNFAIPKTELCYGFIRAVYTATSGAGTATVTLVSLGV